MIILILWIKYFIHSIFKNGSLSQNKLILLHVSKNFIVVNKNYDVRINSNVSDAKKTVEEQLCQQFPELTNSALRHNFHFVHRLDYATSGVLCLALNKEAANEASRSFEKRLVKKYYLAILRGHTSTEFFEIKVPIGEIIDSECHMMSTTADSSGLKGVKNALTYLLVLERGLFDGYPATKVLLHPVTGRRHQLRVHCSHLGHTIVGDYTYSRKKDNSPYRTYLHAYRLILPNRVEDLDIVTSDPFTESDRQNQGWWPVEKLNDLNCVSLSKLSLLNNSGENKY